MRSQNLQVEEEHYHEFTEGQTMEMFRKMCITHYFEENTGKANDEKLMKSPIYLSTGQVSIPAALSTVYKNPSIFAQHRAHGYYLSYGGKEKALVDELLHKESGCAGGMGGSASIHSPEIDMFGHDGLMGSNIPISTGYAFAREHRNKRLGEGKDIIEKSPIIIKSGEKSLAVVGDSAAEEDYFFPSVGWAATKKLPILYVVEDNNLSILTPINTRRSWNMAIVARSYGVKSIEIADDPWTIMHYASKLQYDLPAFMNIQTSRDVWHAGSKKDQPPTEWNWWNRFDLVKQRLKKEGLEDLAMDIESEEKNRINDLWESRKK